jgi:hypothetical protein
LKNSSAKKPRTPGSARSPSYGRNSKSVKRAAMKIQKLLFK